MKRKILLVVCSLMLAVSVQAQNITVKSPSPELKVEFKRCIATESSAFIDLLITNASPRDTKISLNMQWINIYDDEGNVYNNSRSSGRYNVYVASGVTDSEPVSGSTEIPAGISYKARVMLPGGFDKYATMVQLLKIEFTWNVFGTRIYGSWSTDSFEVRNFPIVRE